MSLLDLLSSKPCGSAFRDRRVLVVEDDYILAEDLREQLLSCGAVVLGPVAAVADTLRARGIPFVFATGYDAWVIPDAYAAVPRAEKPIGLRATSLAR